MGSDILDMVLKRVDLEGLLIDDLLANKLEKELQKLVDSTETPFDNMAKDASYPHLVEFARRELRDFLAKLGAEPK